MEREFSKMGFNVSQDNVCTYDFPVLYQSNIFPLSLFSFLLPSLSLFLSSFPLSLYLFRSIWLCAFFCPPLSLSFSLSPFPPFLPLSPILPPSLSFSLSLSLPPSLPHSAPPPPQRSVDHVVVWKVQDYSPLAILHGDSLTFSWEAFHSLHQVLSSVCSHCSSTTSYNVAYCTSSYEVTSSKYVYTCT